MKKPIIFAHRGASKAAPENTMAAFFKALEMKAGGIELDTHLTRDGQLVVAHDDHLGRTSDGSGLIRDMDLKTLRGLDFGGWFSEDFAGEKIPLLSEVFELLEKKNMILNIEIKATPEKFNIGIEDAVVRMIREHRFTEKVIVSSFNHYLLIQMKKKYPEIQTAPLFSGLFAFIGEYAQRMGSAAIHPNQNNISPEVIEDCQRHNIRINTWTADREDDIKRLAALGVDGIITNVPDTALQVMSSLY